MLKQRQKLNDKNKNLLYLCLGWLVLCVSTAFLVYYWRVAYEPSFVSGLALTLYSVLFVSVVYFAACFIFKVLKGKYALQAALFIFVAGLVFVFAGGPLQVPDETSHFMRSYAISRGMFDFNGTRVFSGDVAALMEAFPAAFSNGYCKSMAGQFGEYATLLTSTNVPKVAEAFNFQILPYLPQSLFIVIARLFGFGALGQMYAARIGGLAFYSVICYFALKNCDKYRPIMTAVMFLPISIYISASASYDGLLLSMTYLLVSFLCKDKITLGDLPIMALCVATSAVKLPQLMFVLVLFLIPKEKWQMQTKKGKRISPIIAVLLCIASCVFVYFLMGEYTAIFKTGYAPTTRWNPDVNVAEQLKFVLANPIRTIAVMLFTLYENSFYIPALGSFGALDVNILMVAIISLISLLVSAFLSVEKKNSDKKSKIILMAVLAVAYIASTIGAMYITWTPVAMVRVIGVQVRYFLPAFPLLLIGLSWLLSKVFIICEENKKRLETLALSVSFVVAIISGILLFQHTYIGPFVRNAKIF